jgi:hypothetical protein
MLFLKVSKHSFILKEVDVLDMNINHMKKVTSKEDVITSARRFGINIKPLENVIVVAENFKKQFLN